MRTGPKMKLLEFFTLMLLPLSGGTELIDFVPAKLYWSLKGIPITSETMRAELQTKTAGLRGGKPAAIANRFAPLKSVG